MRDVRLAAYVIEIVFARGFGGFRGPKLKCGGQEKKTEKINPFISNKLKQLTDKLTQDYVDMYMMMHNTAYTKNQNDANIFFKSMINSYKMAETIINIYAGHLINEIEALKNIMHIIKQYHAECTDYFLAHPEEALIKPEPSKINDQSIVSSLAYKKIGTSNIERLQVANGSIYKFKSIDCTQNYFLIKSKINSDNSIKSTNTSILTHHKDNLDNNISIVKCGNCNLSFNFTTIKDFIPDQDLNYQVVDGCLIPISTLSGNLNCITHDSIDYS